MMVSGAVLSVVQVFFVELVAPVVQEFDLDAN